MTNFFEGEVVVVDFATGQATNTLPVGNLPMDVEVRPGSGGMARAYVATLEGDLVELLLQNAQPVPTIQELGRFDLTGAPPPAFVSPNCGASTLDPALFQPSAVVVDAARERVFVPSLISTTVVDLRTSSLLSIFDGGLNAFLAQEFRGVGPVAGCVTDTGDYFCCNLVTSNVSWLRNGSLRTPIDVAAFPMGIACDDQYVYVACLFDDQLHVISQDDGQLVTTVPTGAAPIAVSCDESRGLCHVANFLSGDVTVIDTTTLQPTASSPLRVTDDVTLPTALGVTSGALQVMWNQHFATLPGGPGGGSGDPLCDLATLFGPAGPGSGGVQALLGTMRDSFLASLPAGTPTNPPPFVGIQDVAVRGPGVHVVSAFTGTVHVVEPDPLGGPDVIRSIGSAIANFGPNSISLW